MSKMVLVLLMAVIVAGFVGLLWWRVRQYERRARGHS